MKRSYIIGMLAIAFTVSGYFGYIHWWQPEPFPIGLIQSNGRIEGDHITISSKFPGRIVELAVREGEDVKPGQTLVQLDDKQLAARVDQAKQSVAACEARINAARAKSASLDAQIKATKSALDIFRKEVPLNISSAAANLAHAEALAASADSAEVHAREDFERYQKLLDTKAVAKHEFEEMQLVWTTARNELTVAEAAVTKATQLLAESKLGEDRIHAKEDELSALVAQRAEAAAAVAECVALKAQAEAAWSEQKSILADLTITAPSPGMITTRVADTGEVVAAGSPLFSLVNLDRLYLKVYIPEPQIGKVRTGLKARIHTDAFPDHPFEATLRYISSRAEFTPKEVQTPDERVKLVYAVKLYLDDNPDHCLTPGMPADAVIRWKEDVKWAPPNW